MMLEIVLILIASVCAFGMGWMGGQLWGQHCERLLNPRAGAWEGDE